MKLLPIILLFLVIACGIQNKSTDILGTWGANIPGPDFYREYTFTDKELILYDDGFGAYLLGYTLKNDKIEIFRDGINNAVYQSYYVLNIVKGEELTLKIDEKTIVKLKKIKTKRNIRKIFDDESEFTSYVEEFEKRSNEH
jgi:hypothetical protein